MKYKDLIEKITSGSQIKRQTCLTIGEKSNLGMGELREPIFLWRKRSSSLCSPFLGLVMVQAKGKQGSYLFLYNLGEESKKKKEIKKKKQVGKEGIKVWDSLEDQLFVVCVVGNFYLVCDPQLRSFV